MIYNVVYTFISRGLYDQGLYTDDTYDLYDLFKLDLCDLLKFDVIYLIRVGLVCVHMTCLIS